MFSIKRYWGTFILVFAMILGILLGLILKEKASILTPFGDLFLNLLLVAIPPLIFLTIATSIAKIASPNRLGKVMMSMIVVIVFTSIVAAIWGILVTRPISFVDAQEAFSLKRSLNTSDKFEGANDIHILQDFVSLISVDDFSKILSRQNLIAIAVFAILFGIALKITGEKGLLAIHTLDSFTEVIMSYLKIVFHYAPIGIGCYIASMVGSYGSSIALGYFKTFVLYFITSLCFYFVAYTIYAFLAGGKKGVKKFWKNILPVSLTALATCSSAASIPANILTAKRIGVSDDIATPFIPLATTFHKDGSIIGSVFKIMFLVCLFGLQSSFWQILGISLLAALFVTAIPIGGGVISETLIITMLGCPITALQSLTIIATIIDAPATVLNVVGDTSACMLAARIVDGKHWMKIEDES